MFSDGQMDMVCGLGRELLSQITEHLVLCLWSGSHNFHDLQEPPELLHCVASPAQVALELANGREP